ncbi:MAG: type III polyketide synthase [Acidimicrobiales bacterium]
MAHIASIAAALPAPIPQRAMWDDCFRECYRNIAGAERIWNTAGVKTRHAVVDPRIEDLSGWTTAARMTRYLAEVVPLAQQAVTDALRAAAVEPNDVDLLVVVSCTGYATPGLDLLVAHDVGMSSAVQRVCIGHMGCYAALPGLATAADAVVARGLTAVVLCAELTSLHVQPPSREIDQLVSHALFSDAAVAMVVRPSNPGLRLVDIAAQTDASNQNAMTWNITDLGFRMSLSSRVPSMLALVVRPMIENLLRRHGLNVADVAGWAIHPGGPRILDVCATSLDLDDEAMAPSRDTLRDHGNCSSATVVLVLDRLLANRTLTNDDYVVALAFGPGLTLYAALLQLT